MSSRARWFRDRFGVEGETVIKEERKSSGGFLLSIDGVPIQGRSPADIAAWIDRLEQDGWPE